jgi:transposase
MVHYVGLDVSVKATSVCVVDDSGKVVLEQKKPTEPADIIGVLTSLGVTFGRIGIEAGPLSQWLVNALTAVDLPVICVETRHMKALLTAQQISKTDRNDARGIAQMMRVGLFKPVHVKTLVAQEQRMLLTSRKLDTTARYTQVATNIIREVMSPLDRLTPLVPKRIVAPPT